MNTPATPHRYKSHRFPRAIISHGVWLYFRFCLSYRDVEELLFARGVTVTYEAMRKWCRKFGPLYAKQLRRQQPRPGDKWHLDEVFLTIRGQRHYLCRAVDQDGPVLDILIQPRRDKPAAKKFFRKLLKRCQYVPRVIITDKLKRRPPSGNSCLGWTIASIATSTIVGRTPTSQRASGTFACKASNRQDRLNAFSPPTVPSSNISAHDGICCQRPHTGKR
jgi:DDE domain